MANDSRLTRVQDQTPTVPALPAHAVPLLGGVTLDMNSAGVEEAADRALSAVARKLDGALSVEHTINELIHEASDAANLCMMYQGQCSLSVDVCPSSQAHCRMQAGRRFIRNRMRFRSSSSRIAL